MKRFGGFALAFGLTGLAFFVGCADGEKVDPAGYLAGVNPSPDAGAKGVEEPPSKKAPAKGPADDKGKTSTQGDDDDDSGGVTSSTSSGGASSSGGSSSGGSSTSGGSSSSSSTSGGSTSSSASSSSTSSSGGSSSSSSSSGSSSSSSSSSGAPSGPVSCDTTTVCTVGSGSKYLGYVSGDSGADVLNATGYASHWIRVTVGEDSLGGAPLSMRATLTSPPGANFDLYLHAATCNTPDTKSEKPAGQVDVASISRPDACFGCSDDFDVLIEVRHVGTDTCDTSAKWTLKVEGNK